MPSDSEQHGYLKQKTSLRDEVLYIKVNVGVKTTH